MSDETTPREIRQDGPGHLQIEWADGTCHRYPVRALRLACPCARCVEEMTGRPLLREEDVPADVRPIRITPVGLYAIAIQWSDGHDTGIYTFEWLRTLGQQPPSQEGDP
ncbi:MAG: DUF971 domain-containing protein [Myxococcota bacterium]